MSTQSYPLKPYFGARITGIDVSDDIDDTTFKEILEGCINTV
jgi:hypothetical protein